MARFGVSDRMTAAPTAVLPGASLYAPAGSGLRVREIGVFNSTATACVVSVRRLSTAATQGAALTEFEYDEGGSPVLGTAFAAHTAGTPTIVAGPVRYGAIGAAIGAGYVWTFGENGLIIPLGTGNGIGFLCPTGTGQILDFYIDWDE